MKKIIGLFCCFLAGCLFTYFLFPRQKSSEKEISPTITDKSIAKTDTLPSLDTFLFPKRMFDSIAIPDGFFQKKGDYLILKDAATLRGFNITSVTSSRLPITTLNEFVENYKNVVNGSSRLYTKQYAYTINFGEVEALTRINGYRGIRVYMGIPDMTKRDEETVILTAVDANGSDLYLPPSSGTGAQEAIDKVAPCPYDCPCLVSEATTTKMLGRILTKDPIVRPTP